MKARIRFVITGVHMGLSHDGLTDVIKSMRRKNPVFARAMDGEPGLILFVNTAKTRAKVFAEHGETLAYLRVPGERELQQRNIDAMAATFGGSFDYSKVALATLKAIFSLEKASARPRPADRAVLHMEAS